MLAQIADVAVECVKHPNRRSVWSAELGRYICPDDPRHAPLIAAAAQRQAATMSHTHAKPAINTQFKLVFLTAAGGTFFFLILCVVLTIAAGKEPPPLLEKVVMSLFDLVKVGFGAIVGLLGAQALQSKDKE